ncbi:Protein GRAVITROPIC IN THE LIGHT 1, partial [Mucuna pruriens]
MTKKVSNFSDLIQRVTTSCFLHPFTGDDQEEEECRSNSLGSKHEDEGEEKMVGLNLKVSREENKLKQMRALMEEVFEAVSAMKSAYVSLQEAHCPWDPQNMREADVAVVAQLKKLSVLRDTFRRSNANATTRVIKDLKSNHLHLQHKLSTSATHENKASRSHPHTNLACYSQIQVYNFIGIWNIEYLTFGILSFLMKLRRVFLYLGGFAGGASPEVFEATMVQVKEASKSFTSLLLSLMQDAHWDMAAAVRSMEASGTSSKVSNVHAKYALESYMFRKMFQGFDHESFHMDGSLSSLLNPAQFRRDCFSQYCDIKFVDPSELLGVLPTCHFGKFCSNKYLAIVHPKMEESLFGDLEQHVLVSAGNHPKTRFYNEFLRVAKGVWLLHLLAFSLHPAPSRFEACGGAQFHSRYMESVVKFSGGKVVRFLVSPGFKLPNGSIVKARVYLKNDSKK